MLEVRPLSAHEIGPVEAETAFNNVKKHQDRLAQQERGDVVYLIAWHDAYPVGHVLLKWHGTLDEPMASVLQDCPDIEDLFVHPDYRLRGIASDLFSAVESVAHERGFMRVGLSVGVDDLPVRSMYERRGYTDAGFGQYVESGSYIGHDGKLHTWEAVCLYLIKSWKSPT
jgi:GNAT superfamily N-acetyltransferase